MSNTNKPDRNDRPRASQLAEAVIYFLIALFAGCAVAGTLGIPHEMYEIGKALAYSALAIMLGAHERSVAAWLTKLPAPKRVSILLVSFMLVSTITVMIPRTLAPSVNSEHATHLAELV